MADHQLTTDVWEIDRTSFPDDESMEERARFLLRYAILAPSSHNSQPWEFAIDDGAIEIHTAEERWLEVADPDKRELHISLGCAIENLCIAAEHFELKANVEHFESGTPVSMVKFTSATETDTTRPRELFDEITDRRTDHHVFTDEPIPDHVLDRLTAMVSEDEVTLFLIVNSSLKNSLAELQARADRLQMDDTEYRKELGFWIGSGALGASWLSARIGQTVVTHLDLGDREAQKNSKLLQSAPVIGVLLTETDARTDRVKVGQVYERLALAANSAGVAVHPMSQILERPGMRDELTTLLTDANGLPQHLFRLGYSSEEGDHTPRWPVSKFVKVNS